MDVFHALADPTRRDIFEMLASRGQLSASEISSQFSISAPAISQHLKILREAELVSMQKHAQQRIYQVHMKAIDELSNWTNKMSKLWHIRLKKQADLRKKEKEKLKTRRLDKRLTTSP